MAVTAVICALARAVGSGDTLRGELTVAGQPLIEYQARQLAAAGASRVLILAGAISPAVARCVDRLLSDGINAAVVRDPVALGRAVQPEERLLLMADGLVCPQAHVDAVAAGADAMLLVVPATGGSETPFERIDAHHLWAGLAMVDTSTLSATIDMLGDWDFQSTLLRAAVQRGGPRRAVPLAELQDGQLTIVTNAAQANVVSDIVLIDGTRSRDDRVHGFAGGLVQPLGAQIARWLVRQQVPGATITAIPYAGGSLALLAALGGFELLAVLVMLLCLIAAETDTQARILTRRPMLPGWQRWLVTAMPLVLIILLARSVGWMHGLYLAAVLGIIAHASGQRARLGALPPWAFLTPGSALLVLLPFMLFGKMLAGFAAAILLGLASVALLLHAALTQAEH